MMYSTWIRKSAVIALLCLACSEKPKHPNLLLENEVNAESQFAVIDLDRCNSCFAQIGDKLNFSMDDSTSLVIILSNSKKKAHLFGKEYNINILWDSTRYFEKYVEKNMLFISTQPSK